jgi:2-polyprenyl-3-methyl-5-hydroxy-6-metoxy-1,4-benzoquinol methylase
VSQAEQGARSFGPNADTYHLARPGYPDAAVDWALDGDPATVLDFGAGTGILTVALAARGLRTIPVRTTVLHARTRG